MSDREDLLARLHRVGLRLWLQDGRLCYSAPRGTLTADTLSDLRAHKPELIEMLSRMDQGDSWPLPHGSHAENTTSRPHAPDQPVTATPSQHALWFLTQVAGPRASAAYNMPYLLRLHGAVDIEALSRSLQNILTRHQILRSTFKELDGMPMLVVGEPLLSLTRSDLSHLPQEARQRALDDELEAEYQRPFYLETGPLVRGRLIHLDSMEWMLSLSVHHIVFDEWSSAIFFQELDQFYSALTTRSTIPPDNAPHQFFEYIDWQNSYLHSKSLERMISYWRMQLNGFHRTLELQTDNPRPSVQSFAGASYDNRLSNVIYDKLRNIARDCETTMFVVMFTLFAILLSIHSGQTDICVGTPMANRMKPAFESMIGMFVNMVPLRVDLSGNPSFQTAVSRARKICIEAIDNQSLPFATLVNELRLPRSIARNPLFQVAFSMSAIHSDTPKLGALEVEPGLMPACHAKFDLSMEIGMHQGHHIVTLGYSTELFKKETIARMTSHFCELANLAANKPIARLSDLLLIPK